MTVAWIPDVAVVIIDDGVAVKEMLLADAAPVAVVPVVPAVPLGNPLSEAPQAENNIKNAVSIINLRLIILAGCIFIILSS